MRAVSRKDSARGSKKLKTACCLKSGSYPPSICRLSRVILILTALSNGYIPALSQWMRARQMVGMKRVWPLICSITRACRQRRGLSPLVSNGIMKRSSSADIMAGRRSRLLKTPILPMLTAIGGAAIRSKRFAAKSIRRRLTRVSGSNHSSII